MVQVIGQGRIKPPSGSQRLGMALSNAAGGLTEHVLNQKNLQMEEDKREQRRNAVSEYLGVDLPKGLSDDDLKEIVKSQILGKKQSLLGREKAEKDDLVRSLTQKALSGQELSADEESKLPANVQLSIARNKKPATKRLSEKPIESEQLQALHNSRITPGFDEMDEVDQYRTMIDNGVSPELAEKESKLTGSKLDRRQKASESAYKAQEDFINQTTQSYRAFETETKPRLLQMQKLASDDDLISPTASVFLDAMGVPLGALEDPSSELYNKLSLDLLKGLPESYGNRILKVEVDNFLKTIPSLLNSPSGRRMIASNFLKLGEMKEVYYNAMRQKQRESLDSDKPLPRDFQQSVFDQVKPQINRINEEFVKMSDIKHIPPNTIPFFTPDGQIKFVPKDKAEWAQENGGRRIW